MSSWSLNLIAYLNIQQNMEQQIGAVKAADFGELIPATFEVGAYLTNSRDWIVDIDTRYFHLVE